jgi:Tfp pilus assembly protein PilO
LPEPSLLTPQSLEAIMIGLAVLAVTVGAFFLLKPLVAALARRLEGRGGADPALQGEVEHLREQVAELAPLRERVHELEERMEFTERLLAQRREPELLPRREET